MFRIHRLSAPGVLLAFAFFATIALIFSAPGFAQQPVLLSTWLVTVNLAWLLAVYRLAGAADSRTLIEAHAFPRVAHDRLFLFMVVAGFAAAVLTSFVFAPVYFSDDSIRHIHDGYYLLQGVDVYSVPPEQLPPLLNRLPNHPDVGTIYLPLTQFQAVVGAMVHSTLGFLSVYYAVCFALILLIWTRLRNGLERTAVAVFLMSPVFLITLSARHADVQGVLLVCAGVLLLRTRKPAGKCGHSGSQGRSLVCAWLAGVLLVAAAGLKPEGALWVGMVGLWLVCRAGLRLFRFQRAGERAGSSRRLWRRGLRTALAFALGCIVCGVAQLIFARLILFPNAEAWQSFLKTVALFTQWFAAYNPILDLREWLYPDAARPALLSIYRREILLLALVWLFMPLSSIISRPGQSSLAEMRATRRPGGNGPACRRGLAMIGRLLLAVLAASIVSKGVWHPWYFLWLLPAFWLTGRRTPAVVLAGALPFFYIPVVFLRESGEWWMPVFYGALGVYFFVLSGIIFFRSRQKRLPVGL